MRNPFTGKLLTLCILVLFFGIVGGALFLRANEAPKRITIICSNDTIGALSPCG
jgi:hypothetical protein